MIRKADPNPTKAETLTRAAAYIRMSGRQQDKSPAEQRAEIVKLAAREGCQVVQWLTDEAITGDSSTADRAGLADLLAVAKAGTFKVVLAWHTNRISREDPMDAVVFYNQLRKAGVGLVTCCEGRIDLDGFTSQLLLFVNQKASNDYLTELAAKTLRGRVATVKAGGSGGGPAVYGMDRGLFDAAGHMVRRLQAGEYVKQAGHQVRPLPCTDRAKIDAVRFAFERFDVADLSFRNLARELSLKGYPSPAGTGWTHHNVLNLLKSKVYIGTSRWGATTTGKYHTLVGDDIVPAKGDGKTSRPKPEEDVICVAGAHEGIIPVALFNRVQGKLKQRESHRRTCRHADYPLAGLIVCKHCGQPMYGTSLRSKHKGVVYEYQHYVCSTYQTHGRGGPYNATCGRHTVDAQRVLRWVVQALQEEYLGPGRDTLVQKSRGSYRRKQRSTSATWHDSRREPGNWTGKWAGWSGRFARSTPRNWSRSYRLCGPSGIG
jgi:DNA invertase Pin-like site-specific DNA recombinase